MTVGSLRKIANQTGFQLAGKVLSSLVTLFSLSLITNHYGTEGTGVYTLVLTYISFFYLAADLGLNAYALALLNREEELFSKILGFRLLLAVLLVVIAIFLTFFIHDPSGMFFGAVLFGVVSIIGNAVFTSTNLIFQKHFRYDLSVTASSVTTLLSGVLLWIMVRYNYSVSELLLVTTFCWLLCAFFGLVLVKRFLPLKVELSYFFIRDTLIKIWPISTTLLLNVFYFRVDAFLLNYYRTLSEVGIYNFAYQFFQTALVLPTFIMNALYPLLLEKELNSPTETKRYIIKSFSLMVGIGFVGSVVTYLVSPLLIPLVAYEGGFNVSVEILQVLGLSFPAFFGSAVLMWGLVTLRLNKTMFLIYLVGLLLNIILNNLFIPNYSYYGAAWVTVSCEYIILLLQIFFVMKYYS